MPDKAFWKGRFKVETATSGSQITTVAQAKLSDPDPVGSNQWAVASGDTVGGKALVVNDPHLQTNVPGIWYRASYQYKEEEGGELGSGQWVHTSRYSNRGDRAIPLGCLGFYSLGH